MFDLSPLLPAFLIIGLLAIVFALLRSEYRRERRQVIITFLNRELGR